MTAKVSTNNFFTNFRYRVKSNFRVMVIILVLHLVAAPLNLVNLIIYMLNRNENINDFDPIIRFNDLYPVIGGLSTCLAAAAGIILAMNVFNYLYKKSVVDMTLALPMTTRQRFFSDFLAGLFTYLVPFIISGIISLIINGIGASVVADWNTSNNGIITQSLITLIIAGFFIMLMVYVLTVLVLTCCGSMFEALAYTLLINGLIPGTIAVFGYIFIGNLYGIDLSSNILPVIEKTSPIGALIGLGNSVSESSTLILKASWLIPFILITAVYFIGSYFLYMKRKAEQVSKPFVYKLFYYIMITGLTFCIGILFTLDETSDNIGPLVVITAIIYLIFEVITNRGFRKFYMSVIRYVVTIAAVIGLSLIVEKSDGFGLVDKIPEASDVKSVEMNYNGVFNKFSYYWNTNDLDTYTDEDTINSVISMQKILIDTYHNRKNDVIGSSYNGYEAYSYARDGGLGITNIKIKYNLKSGGSFKRTYYLNFEQFIQLMNVDKTEEFKDNYIQNIKDSYERIIPSDSKKISLNDTLYYSNNSSSVSIDKNKADELLNCLALDIKALPAEEYYTPSKDTLAYLTIGYNGFSGSIAINEDYASVLMFLKKYNISLPEADYQESNFADQKMLIIKPENAALPVDGVDYYYAYSNYYKGEIGNYIDYSPELTELFKHVQLNYITTEPCYMLMLNGNFYIVPPEYTELAEEVFSQSGFVNEYARD